MNAPKIWKFIPALLVCGAVGMAYAKLPPPPPMTDEQKAKAAEAKVKAAEGAKKNRALEEKHMDRVVERYKKGKGVATAAAAPAAKKK